MSRIVIDARELRTSTGRYVERLLYYLQRTKSEHEYIVLLRPKDIDGWEVVNPQFSKLSCPYKEFTFSEQIGLLKQVNSLNADLVHFTMPQQPVLYRGNIVTTIHDLTTLRFTNPDKQPLVFRFKQAVYRWLVRKVVKKSQAVLAISEFTKSDLLAFAHINSQIVTVTLEAADEIVDSPTPLPNLQNLKFIMYIGRPTPHKNLERLVESFDLLRAQHPSLHLVLAGKMDANYRRIQQKVTKTGLKNVVFTDFVTDGELRWLYEHCEAYIFPSLSEGFGLPGLEAMQHSAPVVSSNTTSLPEIYGNAAYYFDPNDTQAMADAINEVLTNKALRQKLIMAGKKQVARYSWQRMADQTLEVYNQVLRS